MSEEMWHVQIEPGEIKTVTLEQMDDMYRLELISASTLVWQPGMPKALPLKVIAGIDEDEDDEIMEIEPELIPEPAYKQPAYAQPTYTQSAYPVAAPVAAPATMEVRQQTMTPPPASTSFVASAPPAPQMPAPDFYSPESLRPITMSGIPDPRLRSSGMGGRVVMGIAIAAGLLVTLHRNDLLRPMAASAGSESAYDKVQAALGSPGFGTTQSVSDFSKMLNPPELGVNTASESSAVAAQAPTTADSPSTEATDTTTETETATDTERESSREDTTVKRDTKAAAPRPRQLPVRRKSNSAPSGKPLKSYKGSEYDPMNAKL